MASDLYNRLRLTPHDQRWLKQMRIRIDQSDFVCQRNCSMCLGTYCVRHAERPCQCDLLARHYHEDQLR